MASGQVYMAAPVCLIENMPDGTLVVNQEAAEILTGVRQPVVVVAIVGLYRTGKSYLMNRLAGKKKGFCLGTTVQALTKGIWMWCLPHPYRPAVSLVLLDTEGLGDVKKASKWKRVMVRIYFREFLNRVQQEQRESDNRNLEASTFAHAAAGGNSQNDTWIFALAILLSSTLVYNSMGTIDQNALENLHFIAEMTKKIRMKASSTMGGEEENSAEFIRFFPDFVWTVRDFTLQLQIDGQPITDDEYLEDALKLQEGDTEQIQKFNMPKLCIRKFFQSRKCFTFDRPASRKKLCQLEELEEEDLEEDFLEPVARFCQHIWETSRPKTIPGGQVVTGRMLEKLSKIYVDVINSGDVPCLENAVLALSEIENAAAVHDAISCYEELVRKQLALPTDTVDELLVTHAKCEKEANAVFMARAFGIARVQKFQEDLELQLKQKKEELCERNKQVSSDLCHKVLVELYQELEDDIHLGIYSVPGGYKRYLEKWDEIVKEYHLVPKKGIQADYALEEFLKSKEAVAKSLLQMDQALTAQEKELEAQRTQAEAAQLQQKVLEQKQARLQQMMEDEKRSHDEQLQLLKEKMEQEKKMMQEETERMIQHKLKIHTLLIEEGFLKKAKEMEREIQRLKEEKQSLNLDGLVSLVERWFPVVLGVVMQNLPLPKRPSK